MLEFKILKRPVTGPKTRNYYLSLKLSAKVPASKLLFIHP